MGRMRRIEVKVDVTEAADLGVPLNMAVTICAPGAIPPNPVIVFACPGAGYSRAYFDMSFEGHEGYSQAEHHTARGIVMALIDYVGVGESTIPDLDAITIEHLVDTYDACCRRLLELLRDGGAHAELPPIQPSLAVGIGQSMGGGLTTLAQGRRRTFDAIAILGFSATHSVLPQPAQAKAAGNATQGVEAYLHVDHAYAFHWEDEPKELVDADMSHGFPRHPTAPFFGSLTIPPCAVHFLGPGIIAAEAAAVAVPVLTAMGERDVCPDPHAEPAAFRSSKLVTLAVFPKMAHMHNFASSRAKLWDLMVGWYRYAAAK
jgi:alpha-beta hydrolase superfamily lysophospholipase